MSIQFSIIIPTYNRPQQLRRCLQSLEYLDFERELWEVIVVNDGGQSSFQEIDQQLLGSLPLKLLHQPRLGPATARNTGAAQACGTYLAFTDDDCRVLPNWLSQFQAVFEARDCTGIGGSAINSDRQTTPSQAWEHYIAFIQQHLADSDGNTPLLLTNNVAYRRADFEALGGFNPLLPLAAAEDFEFGYRLIARGFRQYRLEAIQVWHDHPMTWRAFYQQQFRYGRGAYYMKRETGLRRIQDSALNRPSRQNFRISLAKSILNAHLPIQTLFALELAPFVHRMGEIYEGIRARNRQRSTK